MQIENTLVSLDLIERQFVCDLPLCRGLCCVEGDAGAPLEAHETAELQKALPLVWNELSPQAQTLINKQGVAYIDEEGDTVTSIVEGKDCAFAFRDGAGICRCALEKAWNEGRTSFRKPLSCHLYPVRVKRYETYTAVNYDRRRVCRCAEALGGKEGLPLYRFLKEALIRKFGQAWYEELDLCAGEWMRQVP